MIQDPQRFERAIQSIDAANSLDPHILIQNAQRVSASVLYSQQMTHWLLQLYPQASEALQLATRAQHIRRWEVPRESYSMDRAGYHHWRTGLYAFHAQVAGKILEENGFERALIDRVCSIIRKERLKSDAETQALEDVICVVFLENYFAEFAQKHDEQKVIGILRRTWAKMSKVGQDAALKLSLSPSAAALVNRALAKDGL